MVRYEELADDARVWVYQADRPFTRTETEEIREKAMTFVINWSSHGRDLQARVEVRHNHFIIFIVDEESAKASGCSIDKSVEFIKQLEREYQVRMLDGLAVGYRDGDTITCCSRQEFQRRLQAEQITDETVVFNNAITTKKELEESWEVPVKDSWHRELLPG